jgi:S1-C subfamily serine protease
MSVLKKTTLWVGMTLLSCGSGFAEGRDSFKEFVMDKGDAVITLEVIMDIKFAGYGSQYDSERKIETLGVVVDESGTVVTALSNIDPGSFYSQSSGNEDNYVTRLKSVKYILPDNTELEAGVVLRDPDLDLVFLKTFEASEKPLTFISMEENQEVGLLDEVYAISRLGRIGRRSVAAMSGEIQSVIKKPRLLYVPHAEITSAKAGSPVFTVDGKFVGLNTYYVFPGGSKSLGENDEPIIPVVLPVESILEVAKQAEGLQPEKARTSSLNGQGPLVPEEDLPEDDSEE